ncbi:hypothetical protein EYF80_038343 [Liparis tanakae]|uniref:Uncharacterized protein n=1 Tax=Liparis tanakae TaxID=230148 RepID=A0A4Z2GE07_9TELE|nr:hypothetical protein EYF80_038343 [Liparis tanakae]
MMTVFTETRHRDKPRPSRSVSTLKTPLRRRGGRLPVSFASGRARPRPRLRPSPGTKSEAAAAASGERPAVAVTPPVISYRPVVIQPSEMYGRRDSQILSGVTAPPARPASLARVAPASLHLADSYH